jgi:hypothetical protein
MPRHAQRRPHATLESLPQRGGIRSEGHTPLSPLKACLGGFIRGKHRHRARLVGLVRGESPNFNFQVPLNHHWCIRCRGGMLETWQPQRRLLPARLPDKEECGHTVLYDHPRADGPKQMSGPATATLTYGDNLLSPPSSYFFSCPLLLSLAFFNTFPSIPMSMPV